MKISDKIFRREDEEYNRLPEVFQAAIKSSGKERETDGFRILPHSSTAKWLIFFFIAIDFSFIKQLTDCYFVETWWKTLSSALVVAAIVDIMPSMIAELAKRKHKQWYTYLGITVTALALMAVFTVLFIVRWYSQDLIYETASTQLVVVSSLPTETGAVETETAGRAAMTILFGLIPVVTSVISFLVSYYDDELPGNDSKRLPHLLCLKAHLINAGSSIYELENEMGRDIQGYDDANKALFLDDLNQYKRITREKVKLQIARKRKDPEVLNFIYPDSKKV